MDAKVLFATTKNLTSGGVAKHLVAEKGISLADWITEPDKLQEAYDAYQPDCLIIGVTLFGNKTAERLREFMIKNPASNILVIAFQVNQPFVKELMESGALGIVSAPHIDYSQLFTAIRCVADGRTYLCRESTEALLGGLFGRDQQSTEGADLSMREKQIVRLIADGQSSKEIGRALAISPATVDVHRKNIMRKIGAHKTAEITKYAIRTDLVSA